MLFLTRWFGVTASDADRNPAREKLEIEEIVKKSLLMQKNAADQQHRPLCRGTHAKGVCAEPSSKCLTSPSVATLCSRRGSRREFSQDLAFIPPRCGLETPIRK